MRRSNKRFLRAFFSFAFHAIGAVYANGAAAQAAMSIDEAVRQALVSSPEILSAGASVAAKREYLKAEKRKSWPTLKAEFDALRGSGKPTTFAAVVGRQDPDAPTLAGQTGNYGMGSVVLSTPIFHEGAFFFQETPAEKANAETVNLALSDKDAKAVELSNLVAKAYFDGLAASEQLALQKNSLQKQELRLDGMKKRVLAGLSTETDELSVNTSLLQSHADVNTTQRLVSYQHMLVSQAVGLGDQGALEFIAPPATFPSVPDLEKNILLAIERHPELRSQNAAVNVARSNLASERAERWPELTFELSHTEAGDFYTTGTNSFNAATLKLKATLIDSGQTSARVRARKHEVEENSEKLSQLRTELTKNVYQSFFAYQNAIDAYQASSASVMKAARQEQESQAKRSKNLVDMDTLLQDESASLTAQVNRIKLRYAAWSAWADLLKALGLPYSSSFVATPP